MYIVYNVTSSPLTGAKWTWHEDSEGMAVGVA